MKALFYWQVRLSLEEGYMKDGGHNARPHEQGSPYPDLIQDLGDCPAEYKLEGLIKIGIGSRPC